MSKFNEATEIRKRLRHELPPEAFERTPSRAWLLLMFNVVIGGCMFAIVSNDLAWYWMLAISVILSHHYLVMGFLSHDILHGAVLKNRRLRGFVTFFGFYPFLFSPRLWNLWHNRGHHSGTNTSRDPDANVTLRELEKNLIARVSVLRVMPSPRNRVLGAIFYTYGLTLLGQVILWAGHLFSDWNIGNDKKEFLKARLETLIYVAFWIGLGWYAGLYKSLFLIFLPMMMANAVFISFASSQHLYLPQSDVNNPLDNTASVRVPAWVDALTLNFSHHVEHHLFPGMSYVHLPKVRAWLRANMKGIYMEPSFFEIYGLVFNTPRLYSSPSHLRFPDQDASEAIDTAKIREAIRRGEPIKTSDFFTRFAANKKDGDTVENTVSNAQQPEQRSLNAS